MRDETEPTVRRARVRRAEPAARVSQKDVSVRLEAFEWWPISRPRVNEANARTHPKKQIEELRASLREYGQVWPILVGEDDVIIAGHGRLEAARLEELPEVKVLIARGWSAAQCRAFALLDNRIPMNAGWDAEKLASELMRVRSDGGDPLALGFSKGDLAKLSEATTTAPQLGGLTFSIIVRCDGEQHQGEVLAALERQGLKCEAMIS